MPGYALFFIMMFAPTVYQPIKGTLIGMVLLVIMFKMYRLRGNIPVHAHVAMWTWLMSAVGLFFCIQGLIQGAPGALRVTTVYVLYPLLYLAFVAGASTHELLRGLLKTLVVATVAIGIYTFQFILTSAEILPENLYIELDLGQAIVFYKGFVEFNTWAVATLIYLVPFAAAALMLWPDKKTRVLHPELPRMPISRFWLWVALLLGILLVLLSGRRALLGVVMLAPLISIFLQRYLPVSRRSSAKRVAIRAFTGLTVVTVGGFLYLQFQYEVDLKAMWEMFTAGFDASTDLSAGIRREQFKNLVASWAEVPLLGAGHGASAEAIRIATDPWSYELQYLALLFHVGLIGSAFYAASVFWTYRVGFRVIRQGGVLSYYMIPILAGTTCFLLAQATNPYLAKYDFIWILFLPLIPINLYLRGETPYGDS